MTGWVLPFHCTQLSILYRDNCVFGRTTWFSGPVPTLAAVTGFSDTSVYPTERGAAPTLTSLLGSLPTVNGNAFLRLIRHAYLELSLRDPLCHPLVHTRAVLCMVGYLLPIIDPDHVVLAGSPVLRWLFHSLK